MELLISLLANLVSILIIKTSQRQRSPRSQSLIFSVDDEIGSIYVTAIRGGDYQHTSCSLVLKIVVKFAPQTAWRGNRAGESVRCRETGGEPGGPGATLHDASLLPPGHNKLSSQQF